MGKAPNPGYIALPRGFLERFRSGRVFSWPEAALWLIMRASWKPEGFRRNGIVHLERGQCAGTLREFAQAWNWPKSNVVTFLQSMVDDGLMIVDRTARTKTRSNNRTKETHRITRITICNYEEYSFSSSRNSQRRHHTPAQEVGQMEPSFPGLIGNSQGQPTNQETTESKRSTEQGQRTKPRHGARGRGMIWCDHGTPEWNAYAADWREATGTDKLPERRIGGSGNWFKWLGERQRA